MLATLTRPGSGAASTQTAWLRSARSIRRTTISCSRRSLAERRSCSPRWSSTAGSALRRVEPASATVAAPAPVRRTSSSGLAPRKAASGEPTAEAEAGRKQLPQGAVDAPPARGPRAPRPPPPARAPPSPARRRGSAPPPAPPTPRSAPAAARWRSGPRPSGGDRRAAGAPRSARRAGRCSRRETAPGSTPGPASAHSVRWVRPADRWSASSGITRSAGGNEDHCGARPPSGPNANPPTQTGPAPAGSRSGSSLRRPRVTSAQAATRSPKRSGPRETTSCALPSAASANPSRSGCSQQNQRSPASREANTAALGSSNSTGTVTLTRRRLRPASASSASSDSRAAVAAIKA